MTNIATVFSAELEGIRARIVEVEVDLNIGLHAFNIVGLADKALSEARERVNSALKNSGVKPPNRENRRITVNLAPAALQKTGSQYDLAIALGYLSATRQIPGLNAKNKIFIGELSLDGRLRPVVGALSIAETAAAKGFRILFVPQANANEASVVSGISVVPLRSLREAIVVLSSRSPLVPYRFNGIARQSHPGPDLADIRGLAGAKRALKIAAAGGHNLLMSGPPGTGKSILAAALGGIMPELSLEESVEITKIWSAAGASIGGLVGSRPFRTPHQTASVAAIIGGGPGCKPGEASLAHNGVLFLDELPGFSRQVLEGLRVPLEAGKVLVARARRRVWFPAKFMLVAAMNPCPCGYFGEPDRKCRCGASEIARYRQKISGPLLDRIDIQLKIAGAELSDLRKDSPDGDSSGKARHEVAAAREVQAKRFCRAGARKSLRSNADIKSSEMDKMISLSEEASKFLVAMPPGAVSPRGYYRLLKTARTIADLEGREKVGASDVAEAWSYRFKEDTI